MNSRRLIRSPGNVRIDIRWGEDKPDLERKSAAELVALSPDVVLSAGTLSVQGFQGVGGTLPIVFVLVIDPVGVGLVDNLAKPGGNVTGFRHSKRPHLRAP